MGLKRFTEMANSTPEIWDEMWQHVSCVRLSVLVNRVENRVYDQTNYIEWVQREASVRKMLFNMFKQKRLTYHKAEKISE